MTTRGSRSRSFAVIEAPARQIAENAVAEGSIIVGKLRRKPDFSQGWNAQKVEFGALFSMGVIDPAKVVRMAAAGWRLERWNACHFRSDDRREVETSRGECKSLSDLSAPPRDCSVASPTHSQFNTLKSPGKRCATLAGPTWHDFWISVERGASNLVTASALPKKVERNR